MTESVRNKQPLAPNSEIQDEYAYQQPKPPFPFGVVICIGIGMLAALFFGSTGRVAAPELAGYTKATLGGQDFVFEVANTQVSREQGLSKHPQLSDQEGMLFVFPEANMTCFWMKDMNFNLDILWFDAAQRLVDDKRDLSTSTYPQSFCPSMPALYVIEVKAGTADRLSLKTGDQFTFEKQ